MTDLFPRAAPVPPMAEALRPRSLDKFVGQEHLLGPGKPRVLLSTRASRIR